MHSKGFTLAEVLVGVSLLIIIFVGLYGVFQFALKVVGESKARVGAISLANQKIEEIRNLPYNEIGVVGGIPAGSLPETEEVSRNNIVYTVKTTILYVDDPFDDLAPQDTLAADYKRAKVEVSWSGFWGGAFSFFTDISPQGVETNGGGGTLKIYVLDSYGHAVAQADIHLENDDVFPVIDANYQTNDDGLLVISGAPTSTEGYKITVSKPGFSQDKTYSREEVANPAKPFASVFEGQVTEISFSIDLLSDLLVETRSQESFVDEFGNWSKISDSDKIELENDAARLAGDEGDYELNGWLVSTAISPAWLVNWDRFIFEDDIPEFTSIKYQVFYATGTSFELIPDNELYGNSSGFENSPVDLSGLDASVFHTLKVKASLSTTATFQTPLIYNWRVTYNTPLIGDISLSLQGTKTIGTDAQGATVYKYLENHTSNSSGTLTLEDIEWDSYVFSTTETTLVDLVDTIPSPQPINLPAGTTTEAILFFKAENSLFITAQDASTTEPIFGASVRLWNDGLAYDETKPSGEQGEALFIPLDEALYNLVVSVNGYQTVTTTVNVSGKTMRTINLTAD